MIHAQLLASWFATQYIVVRGRLRQDAPDDRGDVPGWVMVTVMTSSWCYPANTGSIRMVARGLPGVT
jgi:hypothetical protein